MYKKVLSLISKSESYEKFEKKIRQLHSTKEKGDYMEIFAKVYFLSHSTHYDISKYYSRLTDNIPENLKIHKTDVGTDAIIVHNDGKISLIQIKYRKNLSSSPIREWVSGMALESLHLAKKQKLKNLIIFSNLLSEIKNVNEVERKYLLYISGYELDMCIWENVSKYAEYMLNSSKGNKKKFFIKPPKLREWQKSAKDFVFSISHSSSSSVDEGNDGDEDEGDEENDDGHTPNFEFGRKQVIAFCGSGKTLFSNGVVNHRENGKYVYKNILVIVPNLHLLSQWFEVIGTYNRNRKYLLVGSDLDNDENITEKIQFNLTTDSDYIRDVLISSDEPEGGIFVISTYQSLPKIIEAVRDVRENITFEHFRFDVTVVDEAHRTCTGKKNSAFQIPALSQSEADDRGIPSSNFLYITATPKIFSAGKVESVHDMDDEDVYGERYTYSFHQAIKDNIVSDYKIIIGHPDQNITTDDELQNYDRVGFESRFLLHSIKKYNLQSVLIFSSSHEKSRELYNAVISSDEKFEDYEYVLMPKCATSKDKTQVVRKIESGKKIVIFNVRVFSLGSDLPKLQSVMLRGGMNSKIDIVQSVSRCLRKSEGKEYAKLLIPCLTVERDVEGRGDYLPLRKFLSSMASEDKAIIEEVVLKKKGKQDFST